MSSTTATSVRPAELGEKAIKAAAPGTLLRDADIPGLHLRAFAERKSFYLYFRTKTGQERRPKLGDHGVITLDQARKLAKKMLLEVANGGDPIAAREGARNEPTLADLWVEYWKREGSENKTAADIRRTWNADIAPRFGSKKLSAIEYTHVADWHDDKSETAPIQANRALALLSRMFNFAHRPMQWYAQTNPCKGVARNKETKRKRKASREEVMRLVARLRRELDGEYANSAAFIFLLLLTGARKGEIAATRWPNIQGNRIVLDVHKTDDGGEPRVIYLPPAALDVIARLPVTKGTITGILDPKKFWDRMTREENLPDLHIHDLRRTFASIALSTGQISLEGVMQLLGHSSAQTTKVYAHLMEDSATDAVARAADRMLALPAA